MDKTREALAGEASLAAPGRKGGGVPRREALKSLVAGLAAVPRLADSAGRGEQRRSSATDGSVVNARDQLFDASWRFRRGDVAGAERADFEDSSWQLLDLPHDWSVEALWPVAESEA